MPDIPLAKALCNFMICGLLKSPLSPELEAKLQKLSLQSVPLGNYGQFFFTTPSYLDWAENEEMSLLKLGFARLGETFVNASTLLASGVVTPSSLNQGQIGGNTLLLCFDKHQPRLSVYKTLLSVEECFYAEAEGGLVIANNLGAIARFLGRRQLNPQAIPLHFIFRSVPGRLTYFQNIFRLRPGEALYRQEANQRVELCHSLRDLVGDEHSRQTLRPETVADFFEQFKITLGQYLKAFPGGETAPWTMLLSGGIDSSVIQLALNSQLPASTQPISHTFAPDIASFTPEIEYAQAASALFGTRHTFVPVPTADYSDWLIAAIQILGQPPHHESTPYGPALFAYLASQAQPVEYMFSAQGADALFGLRIAEDIRRAEKYQSWPLPLLSLLGQVLGPLSPSKAYGARRAAGLLRELRNPDSHLHPLNAQAAYTNWDIVYRCFTPAEIREALAYRRELEREYLDSPHLIEKTHMVDLLSDAYDTASIDHQLALAFGSQLIFPFLDEAIILASLRFAVQDRFFWEGRTKPVLRQILETHTTSTVTRSPKRGGGFEDDLYDWMREGVLREMVLEIRQPTFMRREEFQQMIAVPSWFAWNVLTFDLYEKHVVSSIGEGG